MLFNKSQAFLSQYCLSQIVQCPYETYVCESQALNAKVGQGQKRSASNVKRCSLQVSRNAVVCHLQPSLPESMQR